jgi:hypothetical protein
MKWNPKFILIEDFAWSELLKKEINYHASYMGANLPIFWRKTDKSMNAKKNRIKGLEGLLAEERLFFLNGWWTDELMKQFTRFTGERRIRNRHDDIPDAISYLQAFVPDLVTGETEQEIPKPVFPAVQSPDSVFGGNVGRVQDQARYSQAGGWKNKPGEQPVAVEPSGNPIDDQFFGGLGLYH